jgi:hypothetical protein
MGEIYEEVPLEPGPYQSRHIVVAWSMRWVPYKPSSEQYRRGQKGRWQRATDYGWENCEAPETYLRPIKTAE